MKWPRLLLLFAALLLADAQLALAQTFTVSGVLRDPQGRTVEDGTYKLTLKLYEQETDGSDVFNEVHGSVAVQHGVFSVELGSDPAQTGTGLEGVTFLNTLWLGIQVENEQEMSPRIKLTPAPYSMGVLGTGNRFPSSGNVGIGRTDPTAPLHVKGDGAKAAIFNSGNVGMGTTSPSEQLDVSGNIKLSAGGALIFDDGTSINTADLGGSASALANDGSALITADADDSGGGQIELKTGTNTRMIIENGGRVGIGTIPQNKLHVGGTLRVDNNVITDGNVTVGGQVNATGRVKSDGNVVADGDVTVGGTLNFSDGSTMTRGDQLQSEQTVTLKADTDQANGGFISLQVGGTAHVNIRGSGNVGIGIGNGIPSARLQVVGDVEVSDVIRAQGGLEATGQVNATGRIKSNGNLVADGDVTAGGDIAGGDINATGRVKADGNVWAVGNVRADGQVIATGEVQANGGLTVSGGPTNTNFINSSGITASGKITSQNGLKVTGDVEMLKNYSSKHNSWDSWNTTGSDGFVVAYCQFTDDAGAMEVTGKVRAPGGSAKTVAISAINSESATNGATVMFPVPSGFDYRVERNRSGTDVTCGYHFVKMGQ